MGFAVFALICMMIVIGNMEIKNLNMLGICGI